MATTSLLFHVFEKSEHERTVAATFFLVLNGERRGTETFRIPEKELPELWAEDDLVAWVNANEKAQEIGPASRGIVPDPEPEPEPVADPDPEPVEGGTPE